MTIQWTTVAFRSALLAGLLAACGGAEGEGGGASDEPAETPTEGEGESRDPTLPGDGTVPGVDFPAVELELAEGQAVLAPSAESWAARSENPRAPLEWVPAVVVEAGTVSARLRADDEAEPYVVPKAVLIPRSPGASVEVGGLIVGAPLGHPMTGVVEEVDGEAVQATLWDGATHRSERLREGEWLVPEAPGAPGTLLHCELGVHERRFAALHRTEETRLVTNRYGRLHALPAEACEELPLEGLPAEGASVRITARGYVQEGTVKSVDAEEKRVVVEYELFRESHLATVQLGELERVGH